MQQGQTAQLALTVTRGGGFTGAISIEVSGAPAGMTASVGNLQTTGAVTTGSLSIVAAAAILPGTYPLVIRASGAGVTDAVVSLQTTVTAPAATGDYSIGITPAAVGVQAGGSQTAPITVARTGGFVGAVTLSLQGAPAGLTGSFSPASVTAATSTLTLVAVALLAPGNYPVTIVGQAAGLPNRSTPASVTVTTGGAIGFTVTLDPPAMEVSPGPVLFNGSVHIARAPGFTGPVTVTAAPFPGTVTMAVLPSPGTVPDDATNYAVVVPAGHPLGTYTTTFKVSAPGFADQVVPFTVGVVAPSAGSIPWHYCVDYSTNFFAVRDGSGPWRKINPSWSNGEPTYLFDITQATGTVVQVLLGKKTTQGPLIAGFTTRVYTGTAQELRTIAAADCESNPNTLAFPAVSGSVSGLGANENPTLTAGQTSATWQSFEGATRSYTLPRVRTGTQELIASRAVYVDGTRPQNEPNRMVARRATSITSGAQIPVVDFNSSEAFAAARATATFTNALLDFFMVESSIQTAAGTNHVFNFRPIPISATFHPIFGFPSTEMRAGDVHRFTATTPDGGLTQRRVSRYSTDVSSYSETFGPDLSAPSLTTLSPQGGLSGFVRATGGLPSEYGDGVALFVGETIDDPREWIVYATRAGLGGGAGYDLRVPDLSGVIGVRRAWYMRAGAASRWRLTAHGGTGPVTRPFNFSTVPSPWLTSSFDGWENMMRPAVGTTLKSAQATGTFTP